MNEIDIFKRYFFYNEWEFRRILAAEFTLELINEYCEELLKWFYEMPLSGLENKQSQYFQYLNFIDNGRNLVGGVETSIEKITHL